MTLVRVSTHIRSRRLVLDVRARRDALGEVTLRARVDDAVVALVALIALFAVVTLVAVVALLTQQSAHREMVT